MRLEANGTLFEMEGNIHPRLIMDASFQKGHNYWVSSGKPFVNPYLPVLFHTDDPAYIGLIATVKAEPYAVKSGAPFNTLLKFKLFSKEGKRLAEIDARGEENITIFRQLISPKEIADTLVSAEKALHEGSATEYHVKDLYTFIGIEEALKMGLPENQYVRDTNGNFLLNKKTNEVKIIKGTFNFQ